MRYVDVGINSDDMQNIVAGLVIMRKYLRKVGQYEEADKFRDTLEHIGIEIIDCENNKYTLRWKEE